MIGFSNFVIGFYTFSIGFKNQEYDESFFSNQISIMYGDGNGTGGGHRRTGRTYVSLNPNTWYSITCIIRGPQDMSIYLDGVNQEMNYDDGGFGGSVGSNEYPFTLGGTNVGNNSSSYYDGKIDELRFWNIELTDPDVMLDV